MKKSIFESEKLDSQMLPFLLMWVAFSYSLMRACLLSVIHDEALTYLNYASDSFVHIVTFARPVMSNNHLLNTLFMKLGVSLFGLHECSLRLGALVGHGLYLIGSYKILRLVLRKELVFFGLCFLLFNPFVIELFSAARGYALGLGFLSFGVYYFLCALRQLGTPLAGRYISFSLCSLALAVLSHLVFLQVYASVIFLITLYAIGRFAQTLKEKKPFHRFMRGLSLPAFLSGIIGAVFLAALYWMPIIRMRANADDFAEGGTAGFWQDTVGSLIDALLYGKIANPGPVIFAFKLLVLAFLAVGIYVAIKHRVEGSQDAFSVRYDTALLLLLATCAFTVVAQWDFLHTRYVTERRAVYFYPLFCFFICALWEKSLSSGRVFLGKFVGGGCLLLALLTSVYFLRCANFRYFYICPYDASTREMLQFIREDLKGEDLRPQSISIGCDWIFMPSINFYKIKENLTWLRWADRRGPFGKHDYYYLLTRESGKLEDYRIIQDLAVLKDYNLKIVKKYNTAKTILAVAP